MTDHLAPVIDVAGVVARKPSITTESGKLVGRAVSVPEHSVRFQQIISAIRVECRATARGAYRLTLIVDARDDSVAVTDFIGQSDNWTAYAVSGHAESGQAVLCFTSAPKGVKLGDAGSRYGLVAPCVALSAAVVRAGYVGEVTSPLPVGKAVYLVDPAVRELRLYDAAGDLSQAKAVGKLGENQVFLADVKPGSPPVRFSVS